VQVEGGIGHRWTAASTPGRSSLGAARITALTATFSTVARRSWARLGHELLAIAGCPAQHPLHALARRRDDGQASVTPLSEPDLEVVHDRVLSPGAGMVPQRTRQIQPERYTRP